MDSHTSGNYRTSREYEKLVHRLIEQNFSGIEGVDLIDIAYDARLVGVSGHKHQIDVSYRFRVWNIEIVVIVECKQYKRLVAVDDLLEFKSRIDDLKAHKGLFVTSSGFQDGARQFAKANGIALLIARGTRYQIEEYFGVFSISPLEETCAWQIAQLRKHYDISDDVANQRISINEDAQTVVVQHDRASLRLIPSELHHSLLHREACEFNKGDTDDVFFEDGRFGNLCSDKVLKALVLEHLLMAPLKQRENEKPIT